MTELYKSANVISIKTNQCLHYPYGIAAKLRTIG